MWLHLLSHHALLKEAAGADEKDLSQLWISFLLCIGFIPPYFAYLTSQIPEDLLPTAILLILIAITFLSVEGKNFLHPLLGIAEH